MNCLIIVSSRSTSLSPHIHFKPRHILALGHQSVGSLERIGQHCWCYELNCSVNSDWTILEVVDLASVNLQPDEIPQKSPLVSVPATVAAMACPNLSPSIVQETEIYPLELSAWRVFWLSTHLFTIAWLVCRVSLKFEWKTIIIMSTTL